MLSKKKKILILSIMAVLLIVTGYLNITLNNQAATNVSNNDYTSESFFETFRTDRTNTRNQEVMYLDSVLASETSTTEAKQLAETKKMSLIQSMEVELVVEGLIKAQGFNDVVVTNTTENVNVVVKNNPLSATEVAQIVAIVKEQTGKGLDNIKIIPVK